MQSLDYHSTQLCGYYSRPELCIKWHHYNYTYCTLPPKSPALGILVNLSPDLVRKTSSQIMNNKQIKRYNQSTKRFTDAQKAFSNHYYVTKQRLGTWSTYLSAAQRQIILSKIRLWNAWHSRNMRASSLRHLHHRLRHYLLKCNHTSQWKSIGSLCLYFDPWQEVEQGEERLTSNARGWLMVQQMSCINWATRVQMAAEFTSHRANVGEHEQNSLGWWVVLDPETVHEHDSLELMNCVCNFHTSLW